MSVQEAEADVDPEGAGPTPGGLVTYAAWLAADRAFERPEGLYQGDELHQALAAAAPHIRIDELDDHIQTLTRCLASVPLFGRRNNGLREGIDIALQLLLNRKEELERRAP